MNTSTILTTISSTIIATLCAGCFDGDIATPGDRDTTSTSDAESNTSALNSSDGDGDDDTGDGDGDGDTIDGDTTDGDTTDGGTTGSTTGEPGCPGDLDCDGLGDADDPLPNDPFPPFIINGTETGVIHLRLSNGDGTFSAPIEVGLPYGGFTPGPDDYSTYYVTLGVSDFDDDGRLDILATGRRGPADPIQMWWFERDGGPTTFNQRLIDINVPPEIQIVPIDLDGDLGTDVYGISRLYDPYIVEVSFHGFLRRGSVRTATCAVSNDPLNPDGCVFVRAPETNLDAWYLGQWGISRAFYGRDLDSDGLGDLLITKYASGGASPSPLGFIAGNGDGTLSESPTLLHTHTLPVNTMILEDFNNDGTFDLLAGCDDDGDRGSLWFYPGQLAGGVYSLDVSGGFETIDFGDSGARCAAAPFDYDGDGNIDLVTGHNIGGGSNGYDPPTELSYARGVGDGSFDAPVVIDSYSGHDAQRVVGPVLYSP